MTRIWAAGHVLQIGEDVNNVHVAVTAERLSVDVVQQLVRGDGDGAVCCFIGHVRDMSLGRSVTRVDYEAYAEMAEREMHIIGVRTLEESGARSIAMHHRVGALAVGEVAVVVAVASAHRDEAFSGCRQAIDGIKSTVPIWKREHAADGVRW